MRDGGYWDSFKHEMCRFRIPAQFIPEYAQSFIEFPPRQAGASFNAAGELKEKIQQAAEAANEHQDKPSGGTRSGKAFDPVAIGDT
jgi:hypothetical protein